MENTQDENVKQNTNNRFILAGIGHRLLAYLFDIFIFSFALNLVRVIYGLSISELMIDSSVSYFNLDSSLNFFFFLTMFLILKVLYQSLFESSKLQGTPGKVILKLGVVNRKGLKISFSRALARNLAKSISGLLFYIGFIVALFSTKEQAFHDIVCKTYVVVKK